jgi:thiosulfate reductase cytochrome b subunit
MPGARELIIIFILLAIFSITGLAIFKTIKSKLPDIQKVFLVISFIFLNVLAAVPFIIFHDYILSREKGQAKTNNSTFKNGYPGSPG